MYERLIAFLGHAYGEDGQDLIEYALLGGLIAAALTGFGVLAMTGAIESMFTGIGNCVDFDTATNCM